MDITEVRIHLRNHDKGKLKAFATITLDDCFVIKDLKIIDGKKGLFVAMPSSKVTAPCPGCSKKNALRNRFCVQCGKKLDMMLPAVNEDSDYGEREEHRDIAHPINSETRDYVQKKVIDAYNETIEEIPSANSRDIDFEEDRGSVIGRETFL